MNQKIKYIPPGATGLLQPLDTHINRPFKASIRKYFEKWYSDCALKPNNKTPKGYVKAPSMDLIVKWALDSWESISPDMIRNSFIHCGNLFENKISCYRN